MFRHGSTIETVLLQGNRTYDAIEKFDIVLKLTVASRGSLCDYTAFF